MTTIAATARTAAFSPEPSPEPLLSPYHLGELRLVVDLDPRSRHRLDRHPRPRHGQDGRLPLAKDLHSSKTPPGRGL